MARSKRKRIGIFGGTFDPPHKGHIAIAQRAIRQLGLERVYFIPAYIPPHKVNRASSSAAQRERMTRLAIRGYRRMHVSPIEVRRKGISYTVDTLRTFRKRFPSAELYLILGTDNLLQFPAWKNPEAIIRLAVLAVYRRKGYDRVENPRGINYSLLRGQKINVSSTVVRARIARRMPVRAFVPRSVAAYIIKHSLYTTPAVITGIRKHDEKHSID